MRKILISSAAGLALLAFSGCAPAKPTQKMLPSESPTLTAKPMPDWVDLSKREKPEAIVTSPWHDIVIGVPDLDDTPKLFTEIGGFTERYRDEMTLVLGAPGVENTQGGLIRFEKTAPDAIQTRPYGSQSWDSGCYFSVMMRAKDIASIIEDAEPLGWVPLNKVAYLEFGPSKLNIVVLTHKATGVQVQLYERLTTPLPDGFPDFERISRPFNMMQMVRDRDAAYDFYQQKLGFETFYFGEPYLSDEPEIMPLAIPVDLTTSIPYRAGITTPKSGLEWGRMEMIEIMADGGKDLSDRCQPGNIGITEVRFQVENFEDIDRELIKRGAKTTASQRLSRDPNDKRFEITVGAISPDGARVTFIHPDSNFQ